MYPLKIHRVEKYGNREVYPRNCLDEFDHAAAPIHPVRTDVLRNEPEVRLASLSGPANVFDDVRERAAVGPAIGERNRAEGAAVHTAGGHPDGDHLFLRIEIRTTYDLDRSGGGYEFVEACKGPWGEGRSVVYCRQTFRIDRWDTSANQQAGTRGLQSLELANSLDVLIFMKSVESARHDDDHIGPFWPTNLLETILF